MSDVSQPKVRAALEKSIRAAKQAGTLDLTAHAALIAVARKLANVMDDPDWPLVEGRFDNVTPAKFLDYCVRLGMVVDATPAETRKARKAPALDELAAFREKARSAV